ncbi:MAG: S4 domain-containing protein [Pseudomonadota bacterium]
MPPSKSAWIRGPRIAERFTADSDGQRIDKWLTYARFAKTRAVAQALVTGGKVRLNRDKITDCARKVRVDDVLTIRTGRAVHVVKVIAFAPSRVSPPQTVHLYERLTD